jgi:hypothetical protein
MVHGDVLMTNKAMSLQYLLLQGEIQPYKRRKDGVSSTLIKKENQIFLIYKAIQSGAVAKLYMRNSGRAS